MKKILIIKNIHKSGISLLKKNKNFKYEIIQDPKKNILKKKLKDFDAISLRTTKFDKELFKLAPKLKIISRHGVGYDNIDINAAKEKKITISITSNSLSATVAEHVFFMMLNISKGLNTYTKIVKEGNFNKRKELPLSKELYKKTILIIGFGRIAKNLIKKCISFDMKVLVYDPYVNKKTINYYGGKKINNLYKSIKLSDYVSIHTPLTKETKNLINMKVLKSMKKSAIIINSSRGGIINENDLNKALNKNIIFGAGLDVFEQEPPNKNNPLLKNKKIILTPHVSTFTEECNERMGIETIQNIIDFFEKKLNNSKIVKF